MAGVEVKVVALCKCPGYLDAVVQSLGSRAES